MEQFTTGRLVRRVARAVAAIAVVGPVVLLASPAAAATPSRPQPQMRPLNPQPLPPRWGAQPDDGRTVAAVVAFR